VPIGRLADEVSWSHEHLIARFRQLTGTTPTPFQAQTPQFGTRGPDVRP
jgi:transcriptional regulator GlxA family with amidase domain